MIRLIILSSLIISFLSIQAGNFRILTLKPAPGGTGINCSGSFQVNHLYHLTDLLVRYGSDSATIKMNQYTAIQHISSQKWLYLFGTFVTASIGTYFYISADFNYDHYKNSTTDATSLHRTVTTEDIVWPIAYGLSAACLTMFIYKNIQQGKMERRYHFGLAPAKNGATFSLLYDF